MATPHQNFDAAGTLGEIRDARAVRRKRRTWGKSRLVPHQAELVKLRAEGASFEDLAFWLLKNKRMKVDRSTVRRFLDKSKESVNGS